MVESLNYEDEKSIDLLKSALLIARLDNQHFNLQDYLIKADQIAAQIRTKFPENSSDHERIKILVQQLFHEMRFHGSSLDYHHRSNSYINEVMDDREGLPITLSVLFIELQKDWTLKCRGLVYLGTFLPCISRAIIKSLKQKMTH